MAQFLAHGWAYSIDRLRRLSVVHNSSNISETTGPIKVKYHMEPQWDGGTKVWSNDPRHWPGWPPRQYKVKTLKNLLLRNQRASDLGAWYALLGTWAQQNLFKWWPLVDLELFYVKVKFAFIKFLYGKICISSEKMLESNLIEETYNKWPVW